MIDLFNRKKLAEIQAVNEALQARITELETAKSAPAKQPEPAKPSSGTNNWQPFRVRKTWREVRSAKEAMFNSRARNALKLAQEIEAIERGAPDVHNQER